LAEPLKKKRFTAEGAEEAQRSQWIITLRVLSETSVPSAVSGSFFLQQRVGDGGVVAT